MKKKNIKLKVVILAMVVIKPICLIVESSNFHLLALPSKTHVHMSSVYLRQLIVYGEESFWTSLENDPSPEFATSTPKFHFRPKSL